MSRKIKDHELQIGTDPHAPLAIVRHAHTGEFHDFYLWMIEHQGEIIWRSERLHNSRSGAIEAASVFLLGFMRAKGSSIADLTAHTDAAEEAA